MLYIYDIIRLILSLTFIYILITSGIPNPPTTKENIKTSMASGEKGWLEPTVITRGRKRQEKRMSEKETW